MIQLNNIIKKYGNKTILNNINIKIKKNDYISIIGKSGSGKSTLMNIIGTLDKEYFGEYSFQGKLLKPKELSRFRNTCIGFIFQQYNLVPNISVYDNILMPYIYHNKRIEDIYDKAEYLLSRFHLTYSKDQIVNTLSGGEQQRIALIRSLLLDPPIIIADEPTGNLDDNNGEIIQRFLDEMHSEGKTIVVVTHDKKLAAKSEKKLLLENGKLNEY